jgi:hypothetical protein
MPVDGQELCPCNVTGRTVLESSPAHPFNDPNDLIALDIVADILPIET